MKFFRDYQAIVAMMVAVVSCVAYVHTTFAAIDYVDKRHAEITEMLKEIKDSIKSIDQKLWEMNKRGKNGRDLNSGTNKFGASESNYIANNSSVGDFGCYWSSDSECKRDQKR